MREFIGSFQCARKIFISEIFVEKPPEWFKIWIYIIGICNYKDQGIFKKGECFTQYKEIQDATKTTRNQVYKCFSWLKEKRQVTIRKTTRGIYIKVLKYDYYQDYDNYKEEAKTTRKTTAKKKRGRNTDDTIIKNDKNDNKGSAHFMPGVGLIKEFKS